MKPLHPIFTVLVAPLTSQTRVHAQDLLRSWNDGTAKQAILAFVKEVTEKSSPKYVAPEDRIGTFDQDGTTWVEHPMYTWVMYYLERVPVLAKGNPELKNVEPFKAVLSGNREAMAKLSLKDVEKILVATLTGMSVDEFSSEVSKWLADFFAELGGLLLMFFAGLEIAIAHFRRARNKAIIFGLVTTSIPLRLGTAVGLLSDTSSLQRSF